jgi:hypothetical protein
VRAASKQATCLLAYRGLPLTPRHTGCPRAAGERPGARRCADALLLVTFCMTSTRVPRHTTGAVSQSASYKQQAVENQSSICQTKTEPPSRAIAEASFDFQMAGRQLRRIVTLTPCENHNQFCVASSLVSRCAWYLLGHLGVFNRQ